MTDNALAASRVAVRAIFDLTVDGTDEVDDVHDGGSTRARRAR